MSNIVYNLRKLFWPNGWYEKAVGADDRRDPEPEERFLELLDRDISDNPGKVTPVDKAEFERAAALVKGVVVDLDIDPEPPPPYAIDKEGWLTGTKVVRVPSPRHDGIMTARSGPSQPRGICVHWTATIGGTGKNIAKSWSKRPAPGQHVGSAQLIIERDGTVYVTMPFHYRAWHAGSKTASATRLGYRANASLVGIEIVAVGRVAQKKDKQWRGWAEKLGVGYGPVVPDAETFEWKGKRYHAFTKEQVAAVTEITKLLQSHYAMDVNEVYDHNEIDPTRKEDCGPWYDDVLSLILKGKL